MDDVHLGAVPPVLDLRLEPEPLQLPQRLVQRVDAFWRRTSAVEPALFRGPVYCVRKVERVGVQVLCARLAQTDFAHYLYSLRLGLPDAYACRVFYAAGILRTADDRLVFGEMAPHTAHAGRLQCVAGALDAADLSEGSFDLGLSLVREAQEEIGVDLDDPSLVAGVHRRFLKEGGVGRAFVLLHEIELKSSIESLMRHYRTFARALPGGQAAEFQNLCAVPCEPRAVQRFLDTDLRPRADYLGPLLSRLAAHGPDAPQGCPDGRGAW